MSDSEKRKRRRGKQPIPADALAERIGMLALEKKARDVTLIDLRGLSSVTDFFVVCTATSDVQAKAIVRHVNERLDEEGVRPWHVEGTSRSRWVLLDFVDVVVHIFLPEARGFYALENLWGDAKIKVLEDEPGEGPASEKD